MLSQSLIDQIVSQVVSQITPGAAPAAPASSAASPAPVPGAEQSSAGLEDITSPEQKAVPLLAHPADRDALMRMKGRTPARIGVGRAGQMCIRDRSPPSRTGSSSTGPGQWGSRDTW